ncbi:tRNA-intron lyase [Candidatus Alkanophaga liquidiphilum]
MSEEGELVGIVVTLRGELPRGYGRKKGDNIVLTLEEAAYLLEKSKILVKEQGRNLNLEEFFKIALERSPGFELRYLVYKDLRERGYYVKPSALNFRLYSRGSKPGEKPSKYSVLVVSERTPIPMTELVGHLERARNMRKSLIIAIVDEESEVTFYEAKELELGCGGGKATCVRCDDEDEMLKGAAARGVDTSTPPPAKMPARTPARASLLEDRVVVWDKAVAKRLYETEWFGKLSGGRLQLSLVEAAYLLKGGRITVEDASGKLLSFKEFVGLASSIEKDFESKYAVYEDLRERRLIVKTGFKFGSHFRVYERMEQPHSKYLVHVVPREHIFFMPELSRAVRLAQSVRKQMVFAYEDTADATAAEGVTEKTGSSRIKYVGVGRVKL